VTNPYKSVSITLDPSWADELPECFECGHRISWDDVCAVPTSQFEDDPPTGAAFIHKFGCSAGKA
jgi:hypothetical protein